MKSKSIVFITLLFLLSCTAKSESSESELQTSSNIELQNPVIPGYFADPSIVQYDGKFYLYATADPWGGDFLSCWVSEDFKNWTFNKLNWPTKDACTSPDSNDSMVWAPSVIEKDGMFYMYISVGSEVWCGKAEHPLGPWSNMLDDQPMIPYDKSRYYHVIDAEAFIDDDGRAYLYWGSGWDWKNGHCFVAELNEDMSSFKTEMKEVTPTRFFEGALMVKHNSKYYLTYSEGVTMDETYEVRYAVGDNPMGPFVEASNSPVLTMNDELEVYGPGHHTIMNFDGKNYIVYHKHRLPFVTGTAYRQISINELVFDEEKDEIKTIIPYNTQPFPNLANKHKEYIQPIAVTASSVKDTYTVAENTLKMDYVTLWEAADNDNSPQLTFEFEKDSDINTMEIRFEYPWKEYKFNFEISKDGDEWTSVSDFREDAATGSPVVISIEEAIQFARLSFVENCDVKAAIWNISFY